MHIGQRTNRCTCAPLGLWALESTAVLLLAGLSAAPGTGTALACARDGVPSISADGRLAVLVSSGGKARLLPASYTPFVFARPARHARSVTFAEDNREVRLTLPSSVFGRPWRWEFGDRTAPAYGTRPGHTFVHAGTYRITVSAYYLSYGVWEPFDLATIRVR